MIEASIRLNGSAEQNLSVHDLVLLTRHLANGFDEILKAAGITGVTVEKVALHHRSEEPQAPATPNALEQVV